MWLRRPSVRDLIASDREFMRELVLRMERSERQLAAQMRQSERELHREIQDFRQRNTAEHHEMIEELRAGRGALLAILDQLGRGGSPA